MIEVKDRNVQYPRRYVLKDTGTGTPTGTYDLEPDTGEIIEPGTPINKELFDSIKSDLETLSQDKVDKIEGKGLSANDFTNDYKTQVESNTTARHSHANKSLLDTYNQTNANIADAVSKRHSHANKATLDTISKTQNQFDEAIADAKSAGTSASTTVASHINNKSNPHGVTAAQIGAATKNELSSGLSGKANTSGSYPNLTVGKATNADNAANATNATNAASATKADAIKQTDTRSTNELPTFYYKKAQAGQNFTFEFKESAAIGLTGQSTYCQLQTYAKWTDSTGGNITQVAVVDTNYFIRMSTGSTGWGAWNKMALESEIPSAEKLYQHNIVYSDERDMGVSFQIIDKNPTPMTGDSVRARLETALGGKNILHPASGELYNTGKNTTYGIYAISVLTQYDSTYIGFHYMKSDGGVTTQIKLRMTSGDFSDNVIEIG